MSDLSSQEGALFVRVRQDNIGLRGLLNACAAGDPTARQHFQEEYGEDIYNFPVKIYGLSVDEAGDFYVYVFDRDRVFARVKTFTGRNNIQFRTFFSFYVLKHLFVEWRRNRKEIATISLQTPIGDASGDHQTLEDILPDPITSNSTDNESALTRRTRQLLNALAPEDRLYLKLFSLADAHLSPEEVRLLTAVSGRTIGDTLMLVAEIQSELKRKDEKVARLCDELDSVWGWIVLRQKELQKIQKGTHALSTVENMVDTEKLTARQHALENALAKRVRQHERLVEELRKYKLTTPYKDIARLLNITVASVYARIFSLRERLVREFEGRRPAEEE